MFFTHCVGFCLDFFFEIYRCCLMLLDMFSAFDAQTLTVVTLILVNFFDFLVIKIYHAMRF